MLRLARPGVLPRPSAEPDRRAAQGSVVPSVELVDYQSTWPTAFGAVADELHTVMAGLAPTIEHIGSTAVPGLCSKPVIDVLVGVEHLAEVQGHVLALQKLGFQYRPDYEAQIPQRRYFVKDASGALPRVHVHAVVRDGPLWCSHVQFRNALRESTELRDRYATLKRGLAVGRSKAAYTEAKGPFIQAVLASVASGKPQGAA